MQSQQLDVGARCIGSSLVRSRGAWGGAVDDSTAAFSPLQCQLKFEFLPLWWILFSALGILYTGYIT